MKDEVNQETNHYVYVLKCADNSLYTGYAIDVERRVREHNGEEKK
jgi:putative endonuclease